MFCSSACATLRCPLQNPPSSPAHWNVNTDRLINQTHRAAGGSMDTEEVSKKTSCARPPVWLVEKKDGRDGGVSARWTAASATVLRSKLSRSDSGELTGGERKTISLRVRNFLYRARQQPAPLLLHPLLPIPSPFSVPATERDSRGQASPLGRPAAPRRVRPLPLRRPRADAVEELERNSCSRALPLEPAILASRRRQRRSRRSPAKTADCIMSSIWSQASL